MPLALLSFFTNPKVVAVLAVLAILVGTYEAGVSRANAAWEKKIAAEREQRRNQVADLVTDLSARNSKLAADLAATQAQLKEATENAIRDIPKYVTPAADAHAVITRGFVFNVDAAWGVPTIPPPTGESIDAAAGISLSGVAAVEDENAGICRAFRVEVQSWREWYQLNSAKYNAFAAGTAKQATGPP